VRTLVRGGDAFLSWKSFILPNVEGAGAPRAYLRFGFHGFNSRFHSLARGVTDPGVGCTDWLNSQV
jgi:hypothetical protein